jgi:hypothetical protein
MPTMVLGRITTEGGGSDGPLLANIYLHYVFDLWAQQWKTRHAQGDLVVALMTVRHDGAERRP